MTPYPSSTPTPNCTFTSATNQTRLSRLQKLTPPSLQDAPGSVLTPETTMDSEIADQERKLAGWALWEEFEVKDRIKTREINTLTAENRKLLDALRKAKAALEDSGWTTPATRTAYAAIIEGLK